MIKYGNTKTSFTKSNRRTKRINRRIPRSIKPSSGMSMKVERDDYINYTAGSLDPFISGQRYMNYSFILATNPAFASQATNFMRYKITGVSITCTPVFTETGLNAAWGSTGVSPLFMQQYPIITSTAIGTEVSYSDNNLMVKPLSLTQSKYWSYKNNYLIGLGNGVGVWNQTNNVSQQQGQIALSGASWSGTLSANIVMYSCRIVLYVQLDGKSR